MTKAEAIARLRAHRDELQRMGVEHLALFGSVARSEEHSTSDVDLAVRLRSNAGLTYFGFVDIEDRIASLLGSEVDVVVEPVRRSSRLQAQIDRDRVHVF